MTGELNLSGLVMPVGGIREKLIAAKRARVKHVILPAGNRSDSDQLPDVIKNRLQVHFAETFEQVATLCLPSRKTEPTPQLSTRGPRSRAAAR